MLLAVAGFDAPDAFAGVGDGDSRVPARLTLASRVRLRFVSSMSVQYSFGEWGRRG
jgi:hypothetical protein